MLSSAMGLLVSTFRGQPLFGDFHESPLVNNSIECNPYPPLQALPGYKKWPVETSHSLTLGSLVRIIFTDSRSFHFTRFQTNPQRPLNSNHLSPHSLDSFHFPGTGSLLLLCLPYFSPPRKSFFVLLGDPCIPT